MPEKRVTCWTCKRYDRTIRRCLDGKANPKRKSDSFTVAELLGTRALCAFNPYRDGIAMRMAEPSSRLAIPILNGSRRSRYHRVKTHDTAPEPKQSNRAKGSAPTRATANDSPDQDSGKATG